MVQHTLLWLQGYLQASYFDCTECMFCKVRLHLVMWLIMQRMKTASSPSRLLTHPKPVQLGRGSEYIQTQ